PPVAGGPMRGGDLEPEAAGARRGRRARAAELVVALERVAGGHVGPGGVEQAGGPVDRLVALVELVAGGERRLLEVGQARSGRRGAARQRRRARRLGRARGGPGRRRVPGGRRGGGGGGGRRRASLAQQAHHALRDRGQRL